MKLPAYYMAVLASCCLISSGLTYCGVKGVYRDLRQSEAELFRENNISVIMMNRKLQQCAYSFGVYIATKGKHGRRYFEEHNQLFGRGMAVDRPSGAPDRLPNLVEDQRP